MLFGRRKNAARPDLAEKDGIHRPLHQPLHQPWRLSTKLLIASSVATVIGFSAICANLMLDMRRGEEELARQTLENLAPASTPRSAATSSSTTCRYARSPAIS